MLLEKTSRKRQITEDFLKEVKLSFVNSKFMRFVLQGWLRIILYNTWHCNFLLEGCISKKQYKNDENLCTFRVLGNNF